MAIDAILFDKDGTLFDFRTSWSDWMHDLILDLARGDRARAETLANTLRFDLDARQFGPDSPVIAGTLDDLSRVVAPLLPDWPLEDLLAHMDASAAHASMAEAVPLAPLLEDLRGLGQHLGVATNASEAEAAAHLDAAGIAGAFDFLAGYDSGFGAKPDPGMCLAFAEAVGVVPQRVLMVGDSLHDLHAGRAAGMQVAAVLTGVATHEELAPAADVVMHTIGELPVYVRARVDAV